MRTPHVHLWPAPFRTAALAGLGLALALVAAGCHDDTVGVRDVTPPSAPQALYSVTGDGFVTLHWVKNTEPDLAGYRVYRGPAFAGPYTPLATTGSTNYTDNGVANGTTYYYAVAAYDLAGNESDLSVENVNDTPRPAGTNVSLGVATAEPGTPAGWDFSQTALRLSGDPETDIYYAITGGTKLMWTRDTSTDIQDAGYTTTLDELDFSPTAGWSPTGTAELILGHSYYVWTRDNHYAKFRVTALTASLVRFDWAYQIDAGNTQLARHPRTNLALQ
jgi:hypothetical protein